VNPNRRLSHLCVVAVALISTNSLSQQTPEVLRGSASLPPSGIAASTKTPRSSVVPPATASREFEVAAETTGLLSSSNPSSPAVGDSDESAPIGVKLALRGVLAPTSQPARRGPILRSIFGPRPDVGIFTVGNFNPVSSITIQNTPHNAVSSNKSSVGGGLEYRRWLGDHNALGFLYVQNPSDGKLLWQGQDYIWPQMRYDFSILATQRFNMKKIAPFVCEGPGVVVTNGYNNSGWSAGLAFVAGLGADYSLSPRFSARTGVTFLDTKSGCYDDQTCHQAWGVVEDLRVGLAYKWSMQKDSYGH
jgi:hypothetical protein